MGRLIDETEVMRDIDAIRPVDPQKSDYAHGIDVGLAVAKLVIKEQQTAQQWITCSNCARNADNGGLYPDGRTRCPIQEHYALPKDGHCHLADPWKGEQP